MNPLHNPYYTPLCKMDEVYGEGTVKRLESAKGPWEYFSGANWYETHAKPSYVFDIYRLAPAIPMTVPWDAIKEGWDWAAADEDGQAFAHRAKPAKEEAVWWSGGHDARIDHLVGFARGTVDWRDSLQRRPGK